MIALRPFDETDTTLLVEYMNMPAVSQYLSSRLPSPYTLDDAQWWVNSGSKQGCIRAIVINNALVGSVGAEPGQFENAKTAETGYWLAPDYWYQGIACIALRLLVAEIQNTTAITRLQATVFEGNDASKRVLEKSGFTLEGHYAKSLFKNNTFYDSFVYGRLISDFTR